jgi:ABC-type phosphate transport system substrate-binding protein
MFGFGEKKSAGTGARAALLAGATVAALGLGGLGAGSASAALSCTGSNIIGQGSSLQKIAQQEIWAPAFSGSVCNSGTHPTVTYESTGSGSGMAEWNYDGKKGSINHERQFIGTDDAPTTEQIGNITSVSGGASVLVIPVAQTAISIIANPPSGCTVEEITNTDLEGMFRGNYTSWSKVSTAEGTCSSPITRVVRFDGSGTSYQFKNYLSKLNKGGLPCTTGGTEGKASWKELEPIANSETGAPNTTWPETCKEKTLSTLVKPAAKGGGEEVKKVNATEGSIGYAALPDAKANSAKIILAVQNNGQKAEGATFANPASGGSANCANTQYEVPVQGRNQVGSTGLNVDWSKVFGANPSVGGTSYPLCTLTYDLAFNSYKAAGFKFGNEVTAHDYLKEFLVAETGQSSLVAAEKGYGALPTSEKKRLDVLGSAKFIATKIGF